MTAEFDHQSALAVCFGNLKGSKDKDLLLTARALKYLKSLPEFGSNRKVGQQVGVSGEVVRQFISLLDLPPAVHNLIDQKKIGLEQGRRLWELHRNRPLIVEDAAVAMASLTAMQARDLAEYLKRDPVASVDGVVQALADAKPLITEGHLICAFANENEFQSLASHAQSRGIAVNDLVTEITRQWLANYDDKPNDR